MARQRPLGSQRNPLGRQSEGCLALVPRQHAPQVAYTHLERTYPGPKPAFFNRLLEDASLEIPAGKSAVIMGASGSGKSSILHLIAGLLLPSSGLVMVDGTRIDTLSAGERADVRLDRVGLV